MSLILVPPTADIRLREILPYLTEEELSHLRNIISLMDEKIFTPIIKSQDKEKAIEKELYHYITYLSQVLIPILPKLMEWRKRPEFIVKLYEIFRKEVKKKVLDRYTRRLIISAINIGEEHDRYTSELLSDISEFVALIENVGPEAYFRTFTKTSLAITVVFLAMDRKPQVVRDLSRIVKKYADELEPFVATFQVYLEPELAPLRKKTSEHAMEKAKELRGSLFETMES